MSQIYSDRPDRGASPDEAAASWLSLLLSGGATDADKHAIDEWRDTSEENDLAWAKITAIWDSSAVQASEPAIARMRREARSRARPRRAWTPFAMAASFLAVIVGAGIYSERSLFGLGAHGPSPPQVAVAEREFHTTVGERRRLALGDGSNITLDTASTIRVAYSPSTRRIELVDGKAFFQVAKDSRRPFVVETSQVAVTAVGTQFSVGKASGGVDVVLLEGHVRAQRGEGANAKSVLLAPGSRLLATAAGFSVAQVDARRLMGWTTGQLEFDQAPLDQVVAELNRYSTRKIVIADPALASLPVTGRFATNHPDDLLAMLAASGGVQSKSEPDGSVELKPAR